ncbi:DegT/DnrJ/EryC1/StrS family aminotransferase [Marinobacter sp.]|uniref:DegT/DnrJ/EryC1/StrS family aminotransferase n=1 Tax=Marinobacter sp. TaxID=50741 RepID=UPI00384BB5C4
MIPMVDIAAGHESLQADIENAVSDVVRSGSFIGGPNVRAFEKEVADFLGVNHAISCASGTDALHLALLAAGVGPADEVITTPFTFFATIEAIRYVGARPVFVDIDPRTFNLDVKRVEAAITPATRAILPVHIFGQPVTMEPLTRLARTHDLQLIEDCAQSFGARRGPGFTGTLGNAGCFSFFPTKNLGACGDGGMITTNSAAMAEKLQPLCNHGSSKRNHHSQIGYNSRLDEMQAAILRIKLRRVNEANAARARVAEWYRAGLSGLPGVETPFVDPQGDHVYHQFTLLVPEALRENLIKSLAQAGVSTAIHYALPAYRQPALGMGYQDVYLPVVESVTRRCLSLPMYPELEQNKVDTIVEAVRRSL